MIGFKLKGRYSLLIAKYLLIALLFSGMLIGCASKKRAGQNDWSLSSEPTSFLLVSSKVKRWKLSNGLEVIYLHDDELPLVRGGLFLRGGSYWEGKDEVGAISAMGALMREGGSGSRTPEEFDRFLDVRAASIESSFGDEYGQVSFTCLPEQLDDVFSAFSDVVLRPRFDPKRIKVWKTRAMESILRREEDPETIAQISFYQALFGDVLKGRIYTSRDIKKIDRVTLLRMHRRFVRPAESVLVIAGDVSGDKIEGLVERYFGRWKGRPDLFELPSVKNSKYRGHVIFIKRPVKQATVYMGGFGPPRHTEERYAIDLFNYVYGGMLGMSRLMDRIRTKLGLVYYIAGNIVPSFPIGITALRLQTGNDQVNKAITESVRVLREIQENGITEEEMKKIQRSAINSFVFLYDNPFGIVYRKGLLEILGFPADYDEKYIKGIRSTAISDISEVAKKYWKIKDFIVVVVGNESGYDQIESLIKEGDAPLNGFKLIEGHFDEVLRIE